MTSDNSSDEESKHTNQRMSIIYDIDRRAVLKSTGLVIGGLSLAGCTGDGGNTATPTQESTETQSNTETQTKTETPSETADAATTGEGETGTTDGDGTDIETDGSSDATTEAGNDTNSGNVTGTQGSSNGGTTHIAIISSSAGFGDRAFNDLAWQGLQNAADEYNIELNQVEETNPANYQSAQSQLAGSSNPDYDLIVLVGYQHTEPLTVNVDEYPDQRWMLINANVDNPNVAGYTWANHQMSFQAGVLAATMTTKDFSYQGNSTTPDDAHIGFVGGADSALIKAFERAYIAGAEWVNQDIQVSTGYIGNFTDASTAADIASSQYDGGADIVYHGAAAAGQGVFQAAQSKNRFAVGVDADQSMTLPEFQNVIMGSAVKYINRGTYQVAEAIVQNNWESVQGNNVLGLSSDAVAVVLGNAIGPELPSVVEQNLNESKQAIINGDVPVPCSASGCQN